MTHVPMYRLTHHARGRMHSRQVDESEIQEVLASPERYVPDPNHGSYRWSEPSLEEFSRCGS